MGAPRKSMSSFDRVLGWLSGREHSEAELRRKMKQKKIPIEEHDGLVERLKTQNFIDDLRFFDVRCRALLNRKQGRMRILQDLKSKGVPWNEERFKELEFEARGEGSSTETLDVLIEKKMRESRSQKMLLESKKDRLQMRKLEQSLLRTLVQKGFSFPESLEALKRWIKEHG